MGSLVVSALCAVLLSSCLGEADRPEWNDDRCHPSCYHAVAVFDPCCSGGTGYVCPNGPNCHNPHGGPPIPEGQTMYVNLEQCNCTTGGEMAVLQPHPAARVL
ncbi:hypothetical protein Bbelb_334450 [Branchiostoma belcheri]|nr:hypothetical protein Bbelb_334450 [Branchiostoma belcheri]